ncbi:MAG: hypothetical protein ACLQVI_27175 [Polyangiaceae bacterium]|jgi:hypothetical protein
MMETVDVTTHNKPLSFLEELREQRWDDHRYYHRSYVNQSLHLLSGCCFLTTYALIPINPFAASIFGWVIAMWPRQIGHVFFEPRGYDEINEVTFDEKESIKVGFNLQRKLLLFLAWLAVPLALRVSPSFFGAMTPWTDTATYLHSLGMLWIWLGLLGFMARALWLCATRSVQTGVAWFTKIITDPFHDVSIYCRSPFHLLRGERLDPMLDVKARRQPAPARHDV